MKKIQFSKLMFGFIIINSVFWVWTCFFLAYQDRQQIAEKLAITVLTTILGTFVAMCVKSYKETKQEKIQNLNEQMYYDSRKQSNLTDEVFDSFEESEEEKISLINENIIEEFDNINSDWEDV